MGAKSNATKIRTVVKSVDQTKNSDSTLATDDELFLPVKANKTYMIKVNLFINCHATPDFKFKVDLPSGASGRRVTTNSPHPITPKPTSDITTSTGLIVTNATVQHLFFLGYVIISTTSGFVNFQWAQNSSNANPSVVKAGSILELIEV